MATRTVNTSTGLCGDAYLSYIGLANFVGQTGADTQGVITFMIA